jgi:hypothetical protein
VNEEENQVVDNKLNWKEVGKRKAIKRLYIFALVHVKAHN